MHIEFSLMKPKAWKKVPTKVLKDDELLQYFDDLSELSVEDKLNTKDEDSYRTESSETESESKSYSLRSQEWDFIHFPVPLT